MNKKILGVFLFAVFTMSSVWAQGRKGLRINEVLVTNETNYQDDYGCQSAWIEIFNTTFGTLDSNEKIEMFSEHDPFGVGMAIMAMAVVFSGLLMLYLMFRLIGQITVFVKKRNAMRVHGISDKEEAKEKGLGRESGEVYAAIAMALYQHLEVHDVEDTILTINKVKKAYSPWNSKIYSLREVPNKK